MIKTTLLVCGAIVLLFTLVFAFSKKHHKGTSALDYNSMIFLDAEDLGEGNIASNYQRNIVPVLKQYVATPAEIMESLNAEADSYTVTSQGKTYVIYSPSMNTDKGENWGNATFALFDIVNHQLQNSPYRFYAINGGNDLGGMFLTNETYERAIKSIKRKDDWPYLPKQEHPWYGQQHDD